MLAIRPECVNLVMPLLRIDREFNPIPVTTRSPKTRRRAVYQLACFFRREFRYDFVQYGYEGKESDPDHVAWLWVHPEAQGHSRDFRVPCIGAGCFRLRESRHALQWLWFHPYWRRRGLLSRAWSSFRERFGDFVCEPPLSEAMQAFLRKVGYHDPRVDGNTEP